MRICFGIDNYHRYGINEIQKHSCITFTLGCTRCGVMDATKIEEIVRVGAAFDNGKAIPVWFLWRNRRYKVQRVCFTWHSSQGVSKLHHYSVTDGANTYELCFNATSLEWSLEKVCAG